MDKKYNIFISHITENEDLALKLKDFLFSSFGDENIEVFVAGSPISIPMGDDWFEGIKSGIKKCDLMIILCSPVSVKRSWINFEAGAAEILGYKKIGPICFAGQNTGDLPDVLKYIRCQAIDCANEDLFKSYFDTLFGQISESIGIKTPDSNILKSDFFSLLKNTKIGIYAKEPLLDIIIWNQNTQQNITGASVSPEHMVNFIIKTNLYPRLIRENGVDSIDHFTIKVKTSNGTVFNALFESSDTIIQLNEIPLNGQPPFYLTELNNLFRGWKINFIDAVGNLMYQNGVYTVWVEAIISQFDARTGLTESLPITSISKTITIVKDIVKISLSKDSISRGNFFSVTITGLPSTEYFLWFFDTRSMSGMSGDQPPMFMPNQSEVFPDTYDNVMIGKYQFEKGDGRTIKSDVPNNPENGVVYYSKVLLSTSGTRTIGFSTSNNTAQKKYKIHVERSSVTGNSNSERIFSTDDVEVNII